MRPALAIAGSLVVAAALAGCGSTSTGALKAQPAQPAATTAATPQSKLADCTTQGLGLPHADVQLTNPTATTATYAVTVGFYDGAKKVFEGRNLSDVVPASQSQTFLVVGEPTGAVPAHFTCKIEQVAPAK